MYGDAIIERLPANSVLQNPDNDMRKLLIYTVGAWLDKYDEELDTLFDGVFLTEATGGYLDLIGKDYGIPRKINETDDDYRERIIYEKMGYLTVDYLIKVYALELYSYIADFDPEKNTMASNNPYINYKGFMAVTDANTREILEKKFIINEEIKWLII